MPELTNTSPYVHSRVDSNTFTMGIGQPYARVDLNLMPESTLSPCQGLRIWPLAGWYDNPIPTRFLAPIDCFKIPAPEPEFVNILSSPGIDSQPGWRNRFLGYLNVYKYGLCTKGYIQPMIAQTPPPRILSFSINYRSYCIREPYWSAQIDDISLWPLREPYRIFFWRKHNSYSELLK
jgi:hypothetical protein